MKKIVMLAPIATVIAIIPIAAHADIYHYNNVIIGDRAIGLGGAYAGVSDDASGVVYNPAGLAFAMGNDISGSANAYYRKKTKYKQIFSGFDFNERSEGFIPSFFGGIQKLDKLKTGLVAGFAVYSPDGEIKDQNDIIHSTAAGIQAFHRTVKANASTLNVSAAAAYRVSSNFSLGFGLGFQNTNELTQEFQLSVLNGMAKTSDGQRYITARSKDGGYALFRLKDAALSAHSASSNEGILWTRAINGNYRLLARGIEPSLGAQFVLGNSLVLGASARTLFLIKQQYKNQVDQLEYHRFYDGSVVSQDDLESGNRPDGKAWGDPTKFRDNTISSPLAKGRTDLRSSYEYDEPFGNWPMQFRGGAAWFATPSLLLTFDVIHSTAGDEVEPDLPQLERVAITNFAGGIEYYVTPSLPVRIGGFTNFDARPTLEEGVVNSQLENIDYYGGSFYLTWAESSSQVGGGAVYQIGTGKANKTGTAVQQDIEADSLILAFSASHQL